MRRRRLARFTGALALALVAAGLVPITTGVGAARADAVVVYYTYHYDYRCQWRIVYVPGPRTIGYLYRVWYRTTHTRYTPFEKHWHGFTDKSVTEFSHRDYPRQIRCAGGPW